jgi:predicted aspartyl protease
MVLAKGAGSSGERVMTTRRGKALTGLGPDCTRRSAAFGLVSALVDAPRPAAARALQPAPAPSDGQSLKTRRDVAARLTASARINGKGPFQFLVDTGANRSGVARELAAALALPAGPSLRVHGIVSAYLADTVEIADFRVGTLHTPVSAPLFERSDLGADGLIGLDMLKDKAVVLDFVEHRLEISNRGAAGRFGFDLGAGSRGVIVPARQRFGQLTLVDAAAGRTRMTCFIDTGAEYSVGNTALRQAVQARQRPSEVMNYDVVIHGATGQVAPAKVAVVPEIRIGEVTFSHAPIAFADLHTFELWELTDRPALLVGMDLLRIFQLVAIDFGAREVLFNGSNSSGLSR